ncbi:hypothetical protein EG346_02715 [Chryseobacterium carnipullorum]|uniref:Uncharacterized protein n=1 Tax=Chryseobacterium carnipullorum TaxID=1124835 RepID=A0A376EHA8_CHRCU|nr:hypothetical protein [Chryseobacterium carnipullorum]MDN5395382.1 hypothetical protein [Chryseobacterium sp.]AZA47172.1 hypothetical protein EG346_02715 [Chryseobacterium carnipullorum]AZA66520.1 hypothetical protein EG345_18845 [Chryseobacterium carnipullorum]MDN5421790.1 hypothetical protein [Chryseobacterium sp.]MDN5475596.1 hypothetical protein [Chryseobacterium sp.]
MFNESFKLDLISSHIEDLSKHKIGLTFYTPDLFLIDIIDGRDLVSHGATGKISFETFMFAFHPQVAIAYYQPLEGSTQNGFCS